MNYVDNQNLVTEQKPVFFFHPILFFARLREAVERMYTHIVHGTYHSSIPPLSTPVYRRFLSVEIHSAAVVLTLAHMAATW